MLYFCHHQLVSAIMHLFRSVGSFLILFLVVLVRASSTDEDRLLKRVKFSPNYSTSIPPEGIINLEIVMEPKFLMEISVQDLQFELEFELKVAWNDVRVENSPSKSFLIIQSLDEEHDLERFWQPSMEFTNCKKCDRVILKPPIKSLKFSYRKKPPGKLIVVKRSILIFSCNYQYYNYPFDTQVCAINITVQGVDNLNVTASSPTKPWGIVTTPEYIISHYFFEKPNQNVILYTFHICRLTGQILLLIYIPSALIVILTWFPFWVEIENLNPKVSVSVTALLALVTQLGIAQNKLPGVSYVKAIDIWMINCIIMVLASLMATTAGNFLFWVKKQSLSKKRSLSSVSLDKLQLSENTPLQSRPSMIVVRGRRCFCLKSLCRKLTTSSSKLDAVCRFLFPTVFLIFLICYFLTFYRSCKYDAYDND